MLVDIQKVNKFYQIIPQQKREVLIDLDLEIRKGETIAIVGRSGSGKSTLLNAIGSLDIPNSGKILFKGRDLVDFTEKERADYRNSSVGFIFQAHHLLPHLSLLENILLPLVVVKDKSEKQLAKARALQLIDYVGLTKNIEQLPGQLSGGECQRTAVVRALINQPDLILADEPTGSLDDKNAELITDLLCEINKKYGVTIVMVTHSEKFARKMQTILSLENGKLAKIM